MIGKFGGATFVRALYLSVFIRGRYFRFFFVESNLKRGGHDKFRRFLFKVVTALQKNG